MKSEQEYMRDLTEIRSMMERSSRFLSLTGWSGIMAGIYALVGAFIAYRFFYLDASGSVYNTIDMQEVQGNLVNLILLAVGVLVLAVGTAIYLSWKKSQKDNKKLWNAAARRVVINLTIPLAAGGIFVLILISKGLFIFTAPVTLLFYGLALLNAGNFTYEELKSLGLIQVILGLAASYFLGYGLLFWAFGFGGMHIGYGIYMHLKYAK
ncbi:hypothetical protein FHG64_01325 [Antarcticibacterium flavum]|uniref:Uncharacterized protein n=2 Tax=Flavobacteriaceae TaxID=49546 RepID=A0A5B7X9C8_9FLAO|nr:hypothetical protein [Antarcticibacterium sp. W02-3]QCY71328.1 hypothetical protein FHG64_01325 [Antarcticibacterium flavum]